MTIYIVWECYIKTDGSFRKIIKKLVDSLDKAIALRTAYDTNETQWLEIEERYLE